MLAEQLALLKVPNGQGRVIKSTTKSLTAQIEAAKDAGTNLPVHFLPNLEASSPFEPAHRSIHLQAAYMHTHATLSFELGSCILSYLPLTLMGSAT